MEPRLKKTLVAVAAVLELGGKSCLMCAVSPRLSVELTPGQSSRLDYAVTHLPSAMMRTDLFLNMLQIKHQAEQPPCRLGA